jgi:DNA-binding HxlR family transcriptional regulator
MLTRTLRGLERDGIVKRTILPSSPPPVEYALTSLGGSLSKPVLALGKWACEHIEEVNEAQRLFDERQRRAS